MSEGSRIRGVVGMATMWAMAFALLALLILGGRVLVGAEAGSMLGLGGLVSVVLCAPLLGAMAGATFASAVADRGRHARFESVTGALAATWGFLAAAAIVPLLSIAFSARLPTWLLFTGSFALGTIGAGIGASTLRLARRAPELAGGPLESPLLPPS